MQRAAGCGPEDLALIDYQYGTWMYAEGEDLQHARDLIDDSLQVRSPLLTVSVSVYLH